MYLPHHLHNMLFEALFLDSKVSLPMIKHSLPMIKHFNEIVVSLGVSVSFAGVFLS